MANSQIQKNVLRTRVVNHVWGCPHPAPYSHIPIFTLLPPSRSNISRTLYLHFLLFIFWSISTNMPHQSLWYFFWDIFYVLQSFTRQSPVGGSYIYHHSFPSSRYLTRGQVRILVDTQLHLHHSWIRLERLIGCWDQQVFGYVRATSWAHRDA